MGARAWRAAAAADLSCSTPLSGSSPTLAAGSCPEPSRPGVSKPPPPGQTQPPAFVCTGNLARRQPGAPTCLVSTVAGASAGDTKPRQFSIWPRRECPDPYTSSLSSWPVPPALRGQPPSSPEAPHGGGGGSLPAPADSHHLGKNLFRIFSVPDSLCSDSRCADDPLCDLGECVSLSKLLLWTFTMRTILLPARRGSCED